MWMAGKCDICECDAVVMCYVVMKCYNRLCYEEMFCSDFVVL